MKKSRLKERDVRYNRGSFLADVDEDAKHDEVKERAYMKRQMNARKLAELKRYRMDWMRRLYS